MSAVLGSTVPHPGYVVAGTTDSISPKLWRSTSIASYDLGRNSHSVGRDSHTTSSAVHTQTVEYGLCSRSPTSGSVKSDLYHSTMSAVTVLVGKSLFE